MDIQSFIDQYPYAFAVAVWLALMFLMPRLTGWHALAELYPVPAPFMGKPHRFQTVWMRWGSHYGNGVTFGANAQGLYLSVLILLRIGHPPIFIPWSEITASDVPGGLSRRVELRFRRLPKVSITIMRALAETLAGESHGAFVIQGQNVKKDMA
jgi:hypothetical protein